MQYKIWKRGADLINCVRE